METQKMSWLNEHAIELNAIVSKRIHDEFPSASILNLYAIPYVWEILTICIFFIQLFSIMEDFMIGIALVGNLLQIEKEESDLLLIGFKMMTIMYVFFYGLTGVLEAILRLTIYINCHQQVNSSHQKQCC